MRDSIWKRILKRKGVSVWSIPAGALWLVSLGYRLGAWIDRVRPRRKICVKVPVISIGNIAVGGSGKTPLVALLAGELARTGLKVGVVSSGYGRKSNESFVESGRTLISRTADEVGDEVCLLAGKLPEAVFAIDLVKAIAAQKLAERGGVDLIVVDDGFQHYGLKCDLDIVTFDASTPDEWLKPLPYGVLREPMTSLARAEIVVITRADQAEHIEELSARVREYAPLAKIFRGSFRSERIIGRGRECPISYLAGKAVFLFAGVGNFGALERQVRSWCGTLTGAVELSDHQRYDEVLVERLCQKIADCKPDLVLTTEKDWVKVRHFDFGGEFYYLDLSVHLEPDAKQLTAFVGDRVKQDRRTI